MIPLKLNPRNFLCYTDVHQPLCFAGMRVACLSGDNGHGKSALLDAITWALWGRARARSADELVHHGCTEMEVEFEFLLDDLRYRVIRKRQLKGRTGLSDLDLAIWSEAGWRPIRGNSIAETERKIASLLHMSYDTFVNSSFLLQGKADTFTTRPPGERKQVLAEILELDEYARLEEQAKAALQQRDREKTELAAKIRQADQELASRADLERRQADLEARLGRLAEAIAQAEAEQRAERDRLARLEQAARQLDEVHARLARDREQAERLRRSIAAEAQRREAAERVLARLAEIERGYADLLAARAQDADLNARLAELNDLRERAAPLHQAVQKAKGALEGQMTQLERLLARLAAEAERIPQAEQALADAEAAAAEFPALEARRQQVEAELQQAGQEARERRASAQHLAVEAEKLRRKIDVVRKEPVCPVCQSELSAERRATVIAEYEAQLRDQEDRRQQLEAEAGRLEAQARQLKAELGTLDQRLRGRDQATERLAGARQALGRAREAAAEHQRQAALLAELRRRLERAEYAPQEQAELDRLKAAADALGYDRAAHDAVKRRVQELAPYEQEQRRLEDARRDLAEAERKLADDRPALAAFEEAIQAGAAEVERLAAEAAGLENQRRAAREAEERLRTLERERTDCLGERGQVSGRLDFLADLERQKAGWLAEYDRAQREIGIYGELASAFGKKGVQALLIEMAIPELEDSANELLARMTDNRMRVKLETQRDTKSGDGVIETLDIRIGDELGWRDYSLFSGGEAFRVNFALRVALSRLLARRAGARLQTLVVDEGFGALDADGRQRFVEAIDAIKDDFELVLAITHISELKESFPVRIEVSKTPRGSVIHVE